LTACPFTRARAGDPAATATIVQSLRPRLTRMAAYYARCAQENPDDLLQEAWVGLLEALREIDPRIGSPEQYLIQRARWRLLDAIKRAQVRRCLPFDETAGEGVSPDFDWDALLANTFVSEFAARLTPTQRAILQCLLGGLTWREAGDALGCTSANVAYHVRQIRRQYETWSEAA
jgi:RNA polymerase sigma-70 factor (ECF subfamily)